MVWALTREYDADVVPNWFREPSASKYAGEKNLIIFHGTAQCNQLLSKGYLKKQNFSPRKGMENYHIWLESLRKTDFFDHTLRAVTAIGQ